MLTKERDQALLTLKQHGLIVNRTIEVCDFMIILAPYLRHTTSISIRNNVSRLHVFATLRPLNA